MKKILIGLLVAVFLVAGIVTALMQTKTETAEARSEATWGQIKACFRGDCVPSVCPENCKDEG